MNQSEWRSEDCRYEDNCNDNINGACLKAAATKSKP